MQRAIYLYLFFMALSNLVAAQSGNFLGDGMQDIIRRNQLLGKVSAQHSLMINEFADVNTALDSLFPLRKKPTKNIQLLPINIISQYNSNYPFGRNDGAMIPARGFQHFVAAGFSVTKGNFTFQLRPELVAAANTDFETFPTEHYPIIWEKYYQWLNNSDNPEKFGNTAYHKIFAGQSFIKYQYKNIAMGISTENIWWGPGRFNALVLSNNAPGFAHLTAKTTRPFETAIGNFESQIIVGSLKASGILPADRYRFDSSGAPIYQPKPNNARSMVGIIMSWQPKWTKGLFVGFTAVGYGYHGATAPHHKKAVLGSLFARYIMPAEQAELYFEYGRNDKIPQPLNLAFETGYPRAVIAGFRKLFPTHHKYCWEFAGEITQLQLPTADLTLGTGNSWYTNASVSHGFTHQGQVLGAGIGPGSNSQSFDFSYVQGINKVGIKLERLVKNNDFYYNTFTQIKDFTRRWVDLSSTLHADWQFKYCIVSAQLAFIRTQNYQWYILEGPFEYFERGYDRINFHSKIALTYRF